jgi:hypothetical protein
MNTLAALSLPRGARCTERHHADFPEIERRWLPYIERKARRLAHLPGLDLDDLVQIGRVALLRALMGYEQSQGSFDRLAKVALRNTFNRLATRVHGPTRLPWARVREDNETWALKPLRLASLNQCDIDPADESLNQAEALEQQDSGEFILRTCGDLLRELPQEQADLLRNRMARAEGSQVPSGLSQRRETYLLREGPRSITARFKAKVRGHL